VDQLIAIVGPTGTGKSDLAVKLARDFGGEVINADSRQFYRYLDIGTAKPSLEERGGIPHYLFDIIDPNQDYNLAVYHQSAYRTINEIKSRHGLPILVGGSGQYIWSVLENWQVPRVPPDEALRCQLEQSAKADGNEVLYQRLRELDPAAAVKIDPRNVRRVIRALEICLRGDLHGGRGTSLKPPLHRMLVIGLTAEREELYRRIDLRVDKMIESGLIEEVRAILEKGFPVEASGFKSVGYKEGISHLKGEMNFAEMTERIKTETHRLVRHQYNWFKLSDRRIHWIDVGTDYLTEAKKLITTFLKEKNPEHGFY